MNAIRTTMVVIALGSAGAAAAQDPHPPAPGLKIVGFYTGTLPCADCEGIRTELTLSQGADRASYWLKETYLGKPPKDATFESGGSWTTETAAYDAKAAVYRLTEARSREGRFFVKVSDDELRMLDRSGRPIQSTLDYSLKRQPSKPESGARRGGGDAFVVDDRGGVAWTKTSSVSSVRT